MQITKVSLHLSGVNGVSAFGQVEFDNCLVVDFRLLEGKNGMFAKLGTSRKAADGKYYDSAYIKSEELREVVTNAIIEKYKNTLGNKLTSLEPAKEA